ncbi:ATP-binding cassette, subfamily B [Amycolatopsis xylanica]|uniref:ATP-binding cassette, subfamily B n=1 Tax=Amycolatopsis xylanica TaxID=589385 RepID=A0A1H3GGQ7_9PSEU|nr:ABC transporter ATP-binding protein [Amycolatopsis xylanica]SDY01828.1 ATP-binding cassette, subfamily B [Amycolatopsis xylanica]
MVRRADRLLLELARANPARTTAYGLSTLLSSSTALMLPATLAAAVDAAVGQAGTRTALVMFCALVVVATVAEVTTELLEVRTTTATQTRLRHRLIRHLLSLDSRAQQRFPSGDALNRVLESTAQTGQLIPMALSGLASFATSLGGAVMLMVIDPWIGLVFCVTGPLVYLLASRFMSTAARLTQDYQEVQGLLSSRFLDAVSGIRSIRAMGTAAQETERVLAPLPRLRAAGFEFWKVQRDVGWQLSLIVPFLNIGVLCVAGYGLSTQRLSPGDMLAVTGYLTYAFGIFSQIRVFGMLGRIRGSAERADEILAVPSAATGTRRLPETGRGELRLTGVRVVVGDRAVLDGIDLTVSAGMSVAVVGVSGTGKSTFAAVAGGLLEPDTGSVCLDGVDLRELIRADAGAAVAYAFERPVLFGETVGEAITFADYAIDQAAVREALMASHAADFVDRLPDRLGTTVDELRISGGELQRIGLARALCRDARVLVLDDAMSSLDTVTEAQISGLLRHLGTTRVIIAHRASTAAGADRVIWLHEGRIAGYAPHSELLEDPGYAELFAQQESESLR